MRILLDLDGVMVDFISGAFEVHGIKNLKHEDVTQWYIEELIDMTPDEFLSKLDRKFWMNLKMYPWAMELIDICYKFADPFDVCLLTSPGGAAAGGKQQWIRENLPEFFKTGRYLIGPAKEMCASEHTVLIDDSDVNCVKFERAGGKAILFPQYWNETRHLVLSRLEYTRGKLEDYLCELSGLHVE